MSNISDYNISSSIISNSIIIGSTSINDILSINSDVYFNDNIFYIKDTEIHIDELHKKLILLDKLLKEHYPEEFI